MKLDRKRVNRNPLYVVWRCMMHRCYKPYNTSYRVYGGKGTRVCERWHDFDKFVDDMGGIPPGKTLDRIDVTKDYSPENCRWVSRRIQSINRKMMPTNTSGFRGVSFAKTMGRWLSAITHRRKRKNLGYFKDKHVAAHAYNKAAIQLHGEHAMLNPVGSKEGVICDGD